MTDSMDEEFNRIEMESRIKQEYVRTMRKTTREEKISRPAVYEVPTEAVLEMRDGASFRYGDHPTSFGLTKRTWVGLTDEEIQAEWLLTPQHDKAEGLWFGRRLEAKLKEKNT